MLVTARAISPTGFIVFMSFVGLCVAQWVMHWWTPPKYGLRKKKGATNPHEQPAEAQAKDDHHSRVGVRDSSRALLDRLHLRSVRRASVRSLVLHVRRRPVDEYEDVWYGHAGEDDWDPHQCSVCERWTELGHFSEFDNEFVCDDCAMGAYGAAETEADCG